MEQETLNEPLASVRNSELPEADHIPTATCIKIEPHDDYDDNSCEQNESKSGLELRENNQHNHVSEINNVFKPSLFKMECDDGDIDDDNGVEDENVRNDDDNENIGIHFNADVHGSDSRSYKCCYCETDQFEKMYHLDLHISKEHGISACSSCNKFFKGQTELEEHIRLHTGEKPFKCSLCPSQFTEKKNLNRHMGSHTGEKQHKCDQCGKSFSWIGHLKEHMAAHTGEKPFKCPICDVSCTRRANLLRHIRTHTEERPFKCTDCDQSFTQFTQLDRHMKTHTGEERFKCTECEHSFSRKRNLVRHMLVHNRDKQYTCDVCSKAFHRKSHLIIHMRGHTGEKPFDCSVCKKSFRYSDSLKVHMRKHSTGGLYKCSICDTACSSMAALKCHLNIHNPDEVFQLTSMEEKQDQMHVEEMQKKCLICNQEFENNRILNLHLRSHIGETSGMPTANCFGDVTDMTSHQKSPLGNEDDKTFQCTSCEKTFSQKYELIEHMRTHTSEAKPYQCVLCGKAFSCRNYLNKHVKRHGTERPYTCPVCLVTFTNNRSLVSHTRTHSVDDISSIEQIIQDTQMNSNAVQVLNASSDPGIDSIQDSGNSIVSSHSEEVKDFMCNTSNVGINMKVAQHDKNTVIGEDKFNPGLGEFEGNGSPSKMILNVNQCDSLEPLEKFNDQPKLHQNVGNEHEQQTFDCKVAFHQTLNLKLNTAVSPNVQKELDNGAVKADRTNHQGSYSDKLTNEQNNPARVLDLTTSISDSKALCSCSVCGQSFRNTYFLNRHMLTHKTGRGFSCSTCNKTFAHKDTLKAHMNMHMEDSPHKCSFCEKNFISNSHLERHMFTHTGEKPYRCELCDKSFSQSSTLTYHMNTHKGVTYSCEFCEKVFNHRSLRNGHVIRVHSGEKPYKCKVCEKSFNDLSNLKKHEKIHLAEKLFKCTVCEKSFHTASHLTRHSSVHSQEKLYT